MKIKLLIACSFLGLAACDYDGDRFYGEIYPHVPGVIHLGNEIPISAVTTPEEAQAAAFYSELGNMGSVARGGATLNFLGNGGAVCVWIDPETLRWNQSVSAASPLPHYSYPDNIFDDGDLDLFGGLSVYYNGSPGETVGNFEVKYEDKLGNPIPIEFNECIMQNYFNEPEGHAGRGHPEYCTLRNTIEGVPYTILLDQFLVPLDDDRLGYGVILAEGTCEDLKSTADVAGDECMILGESLKPVDASEHDYRDTPIRAYGQQQASELAWNNSVTFEQLYCDAATTQSTDLRDFCIDEAENNDCQSGDVRCFCGDPDATPSGGAF
jgi:hypothetical protein